MNEPSEAAPDPLHDPELDAALESKGPLSEIVASRLVARGRAALEAGDYQVAIAHFQRATGHPEPDITGAALLGTGDALFRMDNEPGAAAAWEAAAKLPENASTYDAWRRLAGVRVRAGDLRDAMHAYREADRRAPREDKAEIAARLGWLAKETGNAGAANRYFARSRGGFGFGLTHVVMLLTAAISLIAEIDSSQDLLRLLWLDAADIRGGELYRLLSVTLVHGGYLHLFLNMYALWIVGPIVEQIWGKRLFALFYVVTAIAASTASFLTSEGIPSVGASGAIFGLVGLILAGTRVHDPVLDRRARAIVPQLGMFVIINLIFGFVSAGAGVRVDNAAHIGGLVAGLWLGFVVPPGKAPTLRSAWQHPRGQPAERSPLLVAAGVILLVGVVAAGLAAGGATV